MTVKSYTITYGSYTIPHIEQFGEFYDKDRRQFNCRFIIFASDASDLKTKVAAMEAALRMKNQRLKVTLTDSSGSQDILDIDPDPMTGPAGLIMRPKVTKPGNSQYDTALSRLYLFTIPFELPGDSSNNYLRELNYQISYTPSRRRTLTFNLTYTAGGGNSARTNYEAGIDTDVGTVFTRLTLTIGNFDKLPNVEREPTFDQERIDVTIVYQELLFNQSEANLNEPAIYNSGIRFTRIFQSELGVPRDGKYQVPPIKVVIDYTGSIDVNTAGFSDITTFYRSTIFPYLLRKAKEVWGGSQIVCLNERPVQDRGDNVVSAQITVLVHDATRDLEQYDETLSIVVNFLLNKRRYWTGEDFAYRWWTPGTDANAEQVVIIKIIAGSPPPVPPIPGSSEIKLLVQTDGGGWVVEQVSGNFGSSNMGILPDDQTVQDVAQLTRQSVTYRRRLSWAKSFDPQSPKIEGQTQTVLSKFNIKKIKTTP